MEKIPIQFQTHAEKIQNVKFSIKRLKEVEDTLEIEQILRNEEFKQKGTVLIPKLIKDRINYPYSSVIFPTLQLIVLTDQHKLIFFNLYNNKVLYNLHLQYKNGVKLYRQRDHIWVLEKGTSYETTRFSRITLKNLRRIEGNF